MKGNKNSVVLPLRKMTIRLTLLMRVLWSVCCAAICDPAVPENRDSALAVVSKPFVRKPKAVKWNPLVASAGHRFLYGTLEDFFSQYPVGSSINTVSRDGNCCFSFSPSAMTPTVSDL